MSDLKATIISLEQKKIQALKDAYYQAAEGLQALLEATEKADLIEDHLIVSEMLSTFDRCKLGQVL